MALARKIVSAISKSEEPAQQDELAALQQELMDIGASMPKALQFSIQNLQPYVLVGKSAGFIFMHVSAKCGKRESRTEVYPPFSCGFIRR